MSTSFFLARALVLCVCVCGMCERGFCFFPVCSRSRSLLVCVLCVSVRARVFFCVVYVHMACASSRYFLSRAFRSCLCVVWVRFFFDTCPRTVCVSVWCV